MEEVQEEVDILDLQRGIRSAAVAARYRSVAVRQSIPVVAVRNTLEQEEGLANIVAAADSLDLDDNTVLEAVLRAMLCLVAGSGHVYGDDEH